MALGKIFKAAARKGSKALKENQKKPFNELMSKDKAQQAESGMGTASKRRITSGERGKALSGAQQEYKRILNKLDTDSNLSDEQMEIMLGKLKDLERRYGRFVKPKDMNKGGYAKKKMAKGGYANCGASMAPTQASTKKMAKGGYARKK